MNFRSERGFTLIEMLVVVAIIALLAMLAVPKTFAALTSSRRAQEAADLRQISNALQQHYMERGVYPRRLDDLITRGYLKKDVRFKSPVSGMTYFYAVDRNKQDGPEPKAFILGAPPKKASSKFQLYHGKALPQATPTGDFARAWTKDHEPNHDLWLFDEDDTTKILTNLPETLAAYRFGCRAGASGPCDVYTN